MTPLSRIACVSLMLVGAVPAPAALPPGGTDVLAPDALLSTPVGGLERSRATAEVIAVEGAPFPRALRVQSTVRPPERNATQLTIGNAVPVAKGDVLLASFYLRGASAAGEGPARTEFLFEQATNPWTKSVMQEVDAGAPSGPWRRVVIPFDCAQSFAPGEAMVSFRFGFPPQTIELAGLQLVNYGRTVALDELKAMAAEMTPLGQVEVTVSLGTLRQTLDGFGGNFAQPRYGSAEPMDAVGRYNLEHLRVVHARIGIPLDHWAPEKGVYRDEGPARAALLQMQQMAARGIPITGSIWEGPAWILPGRRESSRRLPPEHYDDSIEAMARFLVTARDTYGARVEYVSFNEPDYGVNFRLSPAEMAEFIRRAGPRFAELGLATKFLTADTANGVNFAGYARPLLEDAGIAPYLGPLAFHCWDALDAPESAYREIAALGQQYGKPVWCTEAGHDSGLWRKPNPWASWENALRTARAYARTLRLSGASQMDYWTYQDNYPLVDKAGAEPYPVWHVLRQMEQALPPGSRVVDAESSEDRLQVLAAVGPDPAAFSLLLVNPVGPGRAAVGGLPPNAVCSVVWSTQDAAPGAVGAPVPADGEGRLVIDLPARSVVTVAGAGAPHPSLPPPGRIDGVGVNIHFTDARPGEMELLAAGGFRWVRMDLVWEATERERGRYDFSAYDRLAAALDARGLRALFILDYSNRLYESARSVTTEEGRQAFARWAAAAAQHFAGRGILWEIWNEPNIRNFWQPEPNLADYTALALAASRAIREAAPGEAIIGPATSRIDLPFLEGCFEAGLLDWWDAVSVHPYRQSSPETAGPEYAELRRLIARHSPPGKPVPILSGEWGYPAVWSGYDADRQGRCLARQWLINLAEGIPLSIWYDWHDDGPDPREPEHHFGTVAHAYHPGRDPVYDLKPAYRAAQTLTSLLDGLRFEKRIAVGNAEDYVLLFGNDDRQILAVWTVADDARQIRVPAEVGAFGVISHTGERLPTISATAEGLLVGASGAPQYLVTPAGTASAPGTAAR